MTRKSRRELEHDVEQLPERVIEHEHCGPNLVIKRTVVETGWEPDR